MRIIKGTANLFRGGGGNNKGDCQLAPKAVARGMPGTDPVCIAECVRFIFSGLQNIRFSVLLENRGAALRGLGEEREMDENFPRIFCN